MYLSYFKKCTITQEQPSSIEWGRIPMASCICTLAYFALLFPPLPLLLGALFLLFLHDLFQTEVLLCVFSV